jgi:hypothetical protein
MPVTKEFIVLMEDRPSTLGKLCQALADRGVNILALQSFPIGGKSVTRFIVDNPPTAKTVLDSEQLTYVEAEIVQAKLPHRPGEIARAASRLGEANIQYQLRILRLGARYEYASRLFWCRRRQHGGPNP